MKDIKIRCGWVFPDTLYLHGERGNILALEKIAEKMGVEAEIVKINLDDSFNPEDFDLLYFSAGELKRLPSIKEKLNPIRQDLIEYIDQGKPLIVTGNSISYFGQTVEQADGKLVNGLQIIDTDYKENPEVYGDDIYGQIIYNGQAMKVFGNQIQMGDIKVNDEKPFTELYYGYGNDGTTDVEGVQKKNSIFTNILGPLLVLNPWLTEEIIKVAAQKKGLYPKYPELNFDLEKKSLDSKVNYVNNKKTNLTNILKE